MGIGRRFDEIYVDLFLSFREDNSTSVFLRFPITYESNIRRDEGIFSISVSNQNWYVERITNLVSVYDCRMMIKETCL